MGSAIEVVRLLGHAQPAAFGWNGVSDGGLTWIAFRLKGR